MLAAHQGGVFGQKLCVLGIRPVDVCAREYDDLAHPMVGAEFEDALGADEVEIMMLLRARPRIVHDVEMDDRVDVFAPKDVFKSSSADVYFFD